MQGRDVSSLIEIDFLIYWFMFVGCSALCGGRWESLWLWLGCVFLWFASLPQDFVRWCYWWSGFRSLHSSLTFVVAQHFETWKPLQQFCSSYGRSWAGIPLGEWPGNCITSKFLFSFHIQSNINPECNQNRRKVSVLMASCSRLTKSVKQSG
jgi:hypothetical protein